MSTSGGRGRSTLAFRFKHRESVEEGVQRILIEQIDDAVRSASQKNENPLEAVHSIRKRIKKIRCLLRLARTSMGDRAYRLENAYFRDLAHQLSDVRDSQILAEAFEKLESTHGSPALQRDRRMLEEHRKSMVVLVEVQNLLPTLENRLVLARDRLKRRKLGSRGWRSFKIGLDREYKRGRRAFTAAYSAPSYEAFHEWRKRVKELNYSIRILTPLWPDPLGVLATRTGELGDKLGDDHDLGVLERFLRTSHRRNGHRLRGPTFHTIARRQKELRAQAKSLGSAIFAEKPKSFVKRIGALWAVW